MSGVFYAFVIGMILGTLRTLIFAEQSDLRRGFDHGYIVACVVVLIYCGVAALMRRRKAKP